MKLINKLLPIVTIASATAVVVPFATSCKSDSGYTEIDIRQLLTSQYSRKTAIKPITEVSTYAEVTDMYLNDIKENPQIFVDDVIEYGELFILDIQGYYPIPETIEQSIQGTLSFKLDNVNVAEHRVSASCKAHLQMDIESTILPPPIAEALGLDVIPLDITIDAGFKDVRFSSFYAKNPLSGDLAQAWAFQPDYLFYSDDTLYTGQLDQWAIKSDHNWKAQGNIKIDCPIYEELLVLADINLDYNYESLENREALDFMSLALPYCLFTPNYLANVALKGSV